MWSVRKALEKFIQSLRLTPQQREEVIRQHTVVREQLRQRLGPEMDFLSGSYSRNTVLRPLHDIDLFIVLESVDSTPPESPDAVLKRVRRALQGAWPRKELPILQQHSVHLEFSTSGIEFDVVPAFKQLGRNAYFIPERQTGRWLRTNPRLHKKRSREANEQAGKKLKPLLKTVKHWNRQQSSSPLGSFHLEAMSYDAFPEPPEGYLEGLESLFTHLSRKVLRPCSDPAGLGPDVDARMSATQRQAASQLLASAAGQLRHVLAEEETLPVQAHRRMRALFGEEYRTGGS
ncbi:CBASS oligonucleotide cyclase [Hyalangium sp.]|uniref:CBASS oligonucleotide cyclase n=1 Tax=Hyalangium sp. TaxID=2028555 RepID=UPI002D5133D1|nr:CBASS oligonucleotide cyclase [Hyalangium sp.]HYI01570.1 CBASS oligonucleotide cyclase [Hyalangium sp.]